MERKLSYKITKEYDGIDIKTYLCKICKVSSALLTRLKSYDDGIVVNGKHQNVLFRLCEGDTLSITMREGASKDIDAVKIDFEILYEDDDIMIINKPPNMPTHPSMGNRNNTLANALMFYFKSKGEEYVFRAVNRLDKDTSGLMCVAKNAYSHHILGEQIKNNTLKRKYIALVWGDIEKAQTVDAPIAREKEGIIKRIVSDEGQRAITHCKPIKRIGNATLTELVLETGRTHQIRVHMSYIGHPLVGDWLYGTEEYERCMLHSSYIEFFHPITNKKVIFSMPIPDDMEKTIKILEKNIEISDNL